MHAARKLEMANMLHARLTSTARSLPHRALRPSESRLDNACHRSVPCSGRTYSVQQCRSRQARAKAFPRPPCQFLGRRYASTAPASSRVRNGFAGLTTLLVLGVGLVYITDTRASIHTYIVPPLMRFAFPDAEASHHNGIAVMAGLYRFGLHPRERSREDNQGALATDVFGYTLDNPLGISAGLDKNGEAIDPLFALGPAILEIGGVTPLPQDGNPKPRVWRVPSQQAIVNRYGLNSLGAVEVAQILRSRVHAFAAHSDSSTPHTVSHILSGTASIPPGSLQSGRLLAVQIAKNKTTPESDTAAVAADYVSCVSCLGPYADILVVNVSSPNTPGLRSLQKSEPLTTVLSAVVKAARAIPHRAPGKTPAVMVKVSPDESSDADIQGIAAAVWKAGVDGVIVANTTKSRPLAPAAERLLTTQEAHTLTEQGGYSGPALLDQTVDLVKRYRRVLDVPLYQSAPDGGNVREAAGSPQGQREPKVIFASGGIAGAEDVLKCLNAGASVAQVYTALTYQGSGFVTDTKRQLKERLAIASSEET